MTVEMRRKLVILLIIPKFLYASPVYTGTTEKSWDKIRLTFNNCARYVFQKRKYDHISHFAVRILGVDIKSYLLMYDCIFYSNSSIHNRLHIYSGSFTGRIQHGLEATHC